MNHLSWRLSLAATCVVLTLFGRVTPMHAAEEDRNTTADRLDRMERRLTEIAHQQEQMMRQFAERQERMGGMAGPGWGRFRPPMAGPGGPEMSEQMPSGGGPPGMGNPMPGLPPGGPGHRGKDLGGLIALILLVGLAFNILVAVWISGDNRRRGGGSGIFVAMAVLAGIPAAIIYTLMRIGDRKV
jgi:hypothetical protein